MKENNKTIVRSGEYKAPECEVLTVYTHAPLMGSVKIQGITEQEETW